MSNVARSVGAQRAQLLAQQLASASSIATWVMSGPGLHALGAIAVARFDEIPLVVFAVDVPGGWSLFEASARAIILLDPDRSDASVLEEAERSALRHPRGPVVVVVHPGPGAGSLPLRDPSPRFPDLFTLEQLTQELTAAHQPLLLAGVGVRSAGVGPELRALAYRLRAPVLTEVEIPGLEHEPPFVGATGTPLGRRLVRNADLVLAVGARLDAQTVTAGSHIARLVQVDHDLSRLDVGAELAMHVDLASTLRALRDSVGLLPAQAVVLRDQALRRAASA